MSPEVMMEILSSEYGWTPSQIREQRVDDVMNYWYIMNERKYYEKQQSKKKK
jgi:hypothetical protein